MSCGGESQIIKDSFWCVNVLWLTWELLNMFLSPLVLKTFLSLSVGFRDSILFSPPYLISLTDASLIPLYFKPGSREPVYFLLDTSTLSKDVQPSHPLFIFFNYPLSEEVSCKLDMECVLPFM